MGHTLMLDVPEELYQSLVKTAKQVRQPPEAIAIQWLASAIQKLDDDPFEPFIGSLSSGIPDWPDEHDKYIGNALAER